MPSRSVSQPPDRDQLDALYLDVFEADRRGAAIFEDLYKRFAAHAKVHTDGGIDAILKTYAAAAHRDVIEYIVTRCNRARGVDEQPEPGEP